MRRPLAILAVAGAALALAPAAALAARVYAVTSQDDVIAFDSENAFSILSNAPLTGLEAGQTVIGLDWRPATGKFVLLSRNGAFAYLYDFDPHSGVASNSRLLSTDLQTNDLGIDVDPVNDELRVVTTDDLNQRIDIDTAVTTTDTAISPANKEIAAIAFTNPDTDSGTGTELFDYSSAEDVLYEQTDLEAGTLSSVGPIGFSSSNPFSTQMDIAPDGTALATIIDVGSDLLLDVDLTSGQAESLGGVPADGAIIAMTAVNNVVSLATTQVEVPESVGSFYVLLGRDAPFDSDSVTAETAISTIPDTATAADFVPVDTGLQFLQGSTTAGFEVRITDDTVDEPDEKFTVAIEPVPGTPVGSLNLTGVTIVDDDPTQVTETKTETVTQTVTVDRPVGPAPIALLAGRCANVRTGTVADDALAGTTAGDRITGLAGADGLAGLAGDDCLNGGAGGDLLSGAAGSDELLGEGGDDVLLGGSENDTINAGGGSNRVDGGSGADTINARNRKRDVVDCGSGRDNVTADRRDRLRRCERVRRR